MPQRAAGSHKLGAATGLGRYGTHSPDAPGSGDTERHGPRSPAPLRGFPSELCQGKTAPISSFF